MSREDLSSNNSNVLKWFSKKISKISSSLLGNSKRVHSVDLINVTILSKPYENRKDTSTGGKFDLMMRILSSPIALGHLQYYLTSEEENKCQYLKFYLACKDLADRQQHFINSISKAPGQMELFQFRQKARVMNIWHTFLESNGDDGGGKRSIFQQSVSNVEDILVRPCSSSKKNPTSPPVASDEEEASRLSLQQQRQQQRYQDALDAPTEEISRAKRISLGMASDIQNISRSPSRSQQKNGGGSGTPSIKTAASRKSHTPYVLSSSDKGPGRLALSPVSVTDRHTFLPSDIVENVRLKMEQSDTTWGPGIFTEALDAALVILHDDVFPRFRQSRYFTKMMHREKYIFDEDGRSLPHAHNLQVRPPSSRIVELLAMGPHSEDATMSQYAGRHYSLEEILEEGMLYEELLSHLSKSHSADSLLCMRMIIIFRELLHKAVVDKFPPHATSSKSENIDTLDPGFSPPTATSGSTGNGTGAGDKRRPSSFFFDKSNNTLHASVEEQAWLIYCYFVAVGSCYEIAIAPKCREAVMMSLVVPHLLMFAELEAAAHADLSSQFREYKNTVSYELMGRRAVTTAISRAHGLSISQKAARALIPRTSLVKKYPVAATLIVTNKDIGPRLSEL